MKFEALYSLIMENNNWYKPFDSKLLKKYYNLHLGQGEEKQAYDFINNKSDWDKKGITIVGFFEDKTNDWPWVFILVPKTFDKKERLKFLKEMAKYFASINLRSPYAYPKTGVYRPHYHDHGAEELLDLFSKSFHHFRENGSYEIKDLKIYDPDIINKYDLDSETKKDWKGIVGEL